MVKKTCFCLKENTMYTFYNPPLPEKRSAWRNAYEIKIAALEHEKRRFHTLHEYSALLKPQSLHQEKQQPGWQSLFKAPLRLLSILLG